jgi:hypothetical protein
MNSAILLMVATAELLSCMEASKSKPETVETETVNSAKKYEDADSMGNHLIIENGGPKGGGYTDPTGKEYFKTIFWTRISNETDSLLELKIHFPLDSSELPSSLGRDFEKMLSSDTMTLDNLKLANYGLTAVKIFSRA